MRKRKKKTTVVLLSATVLSGLCALFYLYYFTDAPPPPDDDLQPSRLAVPEAENGFTLLNIDRQTVVWPSLEASDMDNGEPWDSQVAADVLLKNKALLDSYDASFERKAFQVPELHSLLDSQPYLGGWRELLDLLRIRALSFQRNGEEEDAMAEALKLFCFGQKIEDSGGGFSTCSLGLGLKDKALKLLQGFPRRTKLSSQKIAPYLQEIARHNSHAKGLTETLKIEYRLHSNMIDQVARGEEDVGIFWFELKPGGVEWLWRSSLFFKPNETKELFASGFRRLIRDLETDSAQESSVDWMAFSGGKINPWLPARNKVGRYYFQLTVPTLAGWFYYQRRTDSSLHSLIESTIVGSKG